MSSLATWIRSAFYVRILNSAETVRNLRSGNIPYHAAASPPGPRNGKSTTQLVQNNVSHLAPAGAQTAADLKYLKSLIIYFFTFSLLRLVNWLENFDLLKKIVILS